MTMRGGSVVGCWPQPMLHLSCTFPFLLHHKDCSSYLSFVVSSFPRIPGKCSTVKASVSYSRGENPNAWCRNGARWKCRGGGGLESGCASSSCSSSSSPGGFGNWEPRKVRTGLLVKKKKRRAVLQAAAGEESKTGEKVDYRAYQALMRGGEEVIDLLKEMTELVKLLFFCFFAFPSTFSSFCCLSPLDVVILDSHKLLWISQVSHFSGTLKDLDWWFLSWAMFLVFSGGNERHYFQFRIRVRVSVL